MWVPERPATGPLDRRRPGEPAGGLDISAVPLLIPASAPEPPFSLPSPPLSPPSFLSSLPFQVPGSTLTLSDSGPGTFFPLRLGFLISAFACFSYLGTWDPRCKAILPSAWPFPALRAEVQAVLSQNRVPLAVSCVLIRPPAPSLVDGISRSESVVLPGAG